MCGCDNYVRGCVCDICVVWMCGRKKLNIERSLASDVLDVTCLKRIIIIGASEASPYLVFNVAILSVCLYVCLYVMDRHNILLLGLMILYQLLRDCCAWAQCTS